MSWFEVREFVRWAANEPGTQLNRKFEAQRQAEERAAAVAAEQFAVTEANKMRREMGLPER